MKDNSDAEKTHGRGVSLAWKNMFSGIGLETKWKARQKVKATRALSKLLCLRMSQLVAFERQQIDSKHTEGRTSFSCVREQKQELPQEQLKIEKLP